MRYRSSAVRFPLAGVAVVLATMAWMAPSFAHDAPSGWSYPMNCCSNYDCREIPDASISTKSDGYQLAQNGEVIPYSDQRLRNSPDGHYHWCSRNGQDSGATICLFVPPQAF
jgi:hypothetical protein